MPETKIAVIAWERPGQRHGAATWALECELEDLQKAWEYASRHNTFCIVRLYPANHPNPLQAAREDLTVELKEGRR